MRGSTYGGVSGCRYANISLHMQGQPAAVLLHLTTGIFPANAGVILQIRPAKERYCNIPRERGGQPCVACPGAGMRTFPCICRGQPAAVLLHLTTGIFPANAGVFPGMHNGRTRVEHIPRERGGHPDAVRFQGQRRIYSPRARGSSLV